jgi:hypothetical protein
VLALMLTNTNCRCLRAGRIFLSAQVPPLTRPARAIDCGAVLITTVQSFDLPLVFACMSLSALGSQGGH